MQPSNVRKSLTVFTPTYNRAYCLVALYESLCNQTSYDFEWLVIDDGSTDETAKLIDSFISDGRISIRYVRQDNAGKHVAHNRALDLCDTPLFVCVDSDDRLVPHAAEVVIRNDNELAQERLLGMYYRRVYPDGRPMATAYPKGKKRIGIRELYHRYRFSGDTMIVLRAEAVGSVRFPVFADERFVTEAVFYNELDEIAPMALFEDALYVAEYLEDGYTRNAPRLAARNPYGSAAFAISESLSRASLLHRAKNYANYRAILEVYSLDEQQFVYYTKPGAIVQIASTPLVPHYIRLAERGKALL